jgi:hypothetical protein
MIGKAYNLAWAYAEAMRNAAAHWRKQGLLTLAQQQAIEAAYPLDYYRPVIFVRVMLFIFTLIAGFTAAATVGGLVRFNFLGISLLSAAGCLFVLEASIKSSRLYRSGPDNALLYMGLGWLVALLVYVVDAGLPALHRSFSLANPYLPLVLVPTLALLVAATIRYADRLVAAAAYLTYLLLLTNLLLQVSIGRLLLPFALMLASVAAYGIVRKLARRADYLYYKPSFDWLKALTLITFYLGGNYLIVREGNALLADAPVSTQIPFAPLFYLFTAAIPLIYVAVGLRRADRIWLLMGLLTAGFSCYTLRFYRSVLPPEVAATLAGAVLILLAVCGFRYLRKPRHGLTAAAEEKEPPLLNLESLIVAQTAHAATPEPAGFEFGGGHSGGGGAEGRY